MGMSTSKQSNSDSSKKEKSAAKIWDRFADGYSKKPIEDEEAYQKKLAITKEYMKQDMQVVEIGCGTGGTSLYHAPHVKSILATDISPKMLEYAKAKAKEAKVSNVEFRAASVDQLELPRESQDMVLGLSILHLLPHRREAIDKVHSWLKPGGYFVTSTICIGDLPGMSPFVVRRVLPIFQFFGFVPYIETFKKETLKEEFLASGFSIEHEWQPKEGSAVFIIGKKKAS